MVNLLTRMRRAVAANRSLTVAAPILIPELSVPWDRGLPSAALNLAPEVSATFDMNLMTRVLKLIAPWQPVAKVRRAARVTSGTEPRIRVARKAG